MTSKLYLPDVTLVMIDIQCPELARLAITDSLAQAQFGAVLIFSVEPIEVDGTRWVRVPEWPNIDECAKFMWYELPYLIPTPWWINIQWDGWIIDAGCWSDEFLKYDYTGAPWWYDDGLNVGNGCALRSTRLMRFVAENKEHFPLVRYQEDDLLCRAYRPTLEKKGFAWAPETVAARFSFECTRPSPQSRHFMFHDSFNFPFVLTGNRLAERIRLMWENPHLQSGRKINELRAGRRPLILERLAS